MDALKSAGRAIIKSPGVPRHTWGTSKHEKLPENWTDTSETLLEGVVFNVKYLGLTLVGQPKGEDMAAAAIRRIVSMARASAKKFRKVTLTISPKGIIIGDSETGDLVENVSIYRISYCTADRTQDKVFAYVSQSRFNETLECHAFLCQKKKIAQAVTLTVAQAFKVALDQWEIAQEGECHSQVCDIFCVLAMQLSVVTNPHCVLTLLDKSKKARKSCSCSKDKFEPETRPQGDSGNITILKCIINTNINIWNNLKSKTQVQIPLTTIVSPWSNPKLLSPVNTDCKSLWVRASDKFCICKSLKHLHLQYLVDSHEQLT
uniref:PID domain-containing protein n=1 Tax=Denticeps clupeoides TaxID=299321 RepID=A0AAY4AYP5_9TELE